MRPIRPSTKAGALLTVVAAACPPALQAASGDVTLNQFLERQTDRIMAADSDGDGKVSRVEIAAATSAKGAAKTGRDPSRMFDHMDLDRDGYLERTEIATVLTRRFHRMDRNGDGMLTPDERMAARTDRERNARTDAAATSSP